MTITAETKFFAGIILTTGIILAVAMIVLSRPTPVVTLSKESLIPPTAHTKGNVHANVWLVEFSDFQCPACAAFAPVVDKLVSDNTNALYFAYRHFPLTMHQFAIPSAMAAEAAGAQGKFYEASSYLFANQAKFSDSFWNTMASDLLLDMTKFTKDLNDKTKKSTIDQDLQQATALNLPGTPTFFLNGVLLKNIANPQDLVTAVNAAIANTK